jgi:hypothetical protein
MEKYTIYDPETLLIREVVFAEVQPDNSTTAMVTTLMVKPKFNPETGEIHESATVAEITAYCAMMCEALPPEDHAAFLAQFVTI